MAVKTHVGVHCFRGQSTSAFYFLPSFMCSQTVPPHFVLGTGLPQYVTGARTYRYVPVGMYGACTGTCFKMCHKCCLQVWLFSFHRRIGYQLRNISPRACKLL